MKYTNYVISFYLVFNITLVSIKSLRVQKLWGREVFSSDSKNTFKDLWRKLRNLHRIFDHGLYCVLIRSNSWFSLVSNVGKDVERIWSCLQIRRCESLPGLVGVWSQRSRDRLCCTICLHGCTTPELCSPSENTQIFFLQTLMAFLIKANIPQSLQDSQN